MPVNGRNFEYLSGEDPFLGYTLVQPVIQGIQSQVRVCPRAVRADESRVMACDWLMIAMLTVGCGCDKRSHRCCRHVTCLCRDCACPPSLSLCKPLSLYVHHACRVSTVCPAASVCAQGVIANVKHFVMNNQETNRQEVSANVDERTRWEMYMPPFLGAVEAGVLSAMCSYNKINNVYACENEVTLNASLKGFAGFQGWVMSDWTATHSTVNAVKAGLDQEMPIAFYFSSVALQLALDAGDITQAMIDDKVLRILTAMFTAGLFDRAPSGDIHANVTSPAHNALAREFATEAIVLLKNSGGVLPLSKNAAGRTIAVIGDACSTAPIVGGEGSGYVGPPYIITVADGVSSKASGATIRVVGTNVTEAVAAATSADVAIVCTATTSSEGIDRANLDLPAAENAVIAAVAAAQKNTVVVVTSPGAVLLPWIDAVPAAIATFMPGQEAGNAIADILFGDANPSGKLPLTFPLTNNPTNFTPAQYPGLPSLFPLEANYSEGLLIGYRWYDAHHVTPLFPFGHGLSYTQFKYSGLTASATNVTIVLTNTGSVAGAEVAQLYLAFPSAANEPPLQLKGFGKVMLQPGQSATVAFPVTARDLSIWDATTHDWAMQHGTFGVYVGASSRDIRAKGTFTV